MKISSGEIFISKYSFPYIIDKGICLCVLLVGGMLFAQHLSPLVGIQRGEEGVGFGGCVVYQGVALSATCLFIVL